MQCKFLLIEGKNSIREDVQVLLNKRFHALDIVIYTTAYCQEHFNNIAWEDFNLVLINCPYSIDESFSKLTAIKLLQNSPMVLVLTQSQTVADKVLQAGADNVFLHNNCLSDLAYKVENLLELKQYLTQYPFTASDYQVHEVIHDTDDAIIFRASYKGKVAVAVKRFKYNLSTLKPNLIYRLKAGLKSSVDLKHSGLVNVMTFGISDHALYMTMEYVEGGDLKSILDTHGVPPLTQSLGWFVEITEAIGAIHRAGLLHRDLKTSNILLKDDGTLALTDYGVEKQLLIDVGYIAEDEIFCTPYYVSPERVTGNCCTEASDIYSLGIIFYELLTGDRPFNATSLLDLMKMHILAPVPKLSSELEQYQNFLESMLAKCPDQRLSSADEVLSKLGDLMESEPA